MTRINENYFENFSFLRVILNLNNEKEYRR